MKTKRNPTPRKRVTVYFSPGPEQEMLNSISGRDKDGKPQADRKQLTYQNAIISALMIADRISKLSELGVAFIFDSTEHPELSGIRFDPGRNK